MALIITMILERDCKIRQIVKKSVLVFSKKLLQIFDKWQVWRKKQEVDIPAVLHGLKFRHLSLLAKDVRLAVTDHFTAVTIQNYRIWNSNVPVTIFREKTLKLVNRTATELRQIFKQVQSLKRYKLMRD